MSLQWSFSCLCQDFGWAAGLSLPLPLPLLMLLCCWYCGCCCCCWQMEHIWLHPKQRKQTDAEIYIRKNGHPSGEYKTCQEGGGEGTRINAWILMACQPVHFKLCAARGACVLLGRKWVAVPGQAGNGPETSRGGPGIVMFCRCIALTSGQHNSLTQTTVMYTLCTYILFCGSQQISLLLYSPFSAFCLC